MENWRISRIEDELGKLPDFRVEKLPDFSVEKLPDFSDDPDLQKYLSGACFSENKNCVEDEGFSEERSGLDSSSSSCDLPSKVADINLESWDSGPNGYHDNFPHVNGISGSCPSVDTSITMNKQFPSDEFVQTCPKRSYTEGHQSVYKPRAEEDRTTMDYVKKDKLYSSMQAQEAAQHFVDKYDSPERLNISRGVTGGGSFSHSKSVPAFTSNWQSNSTAGGKFLSAATPRLSTLRSPNIPRANTGYSLARRDIHASRETGMTDPGGMIPDSAVHSNPLPPPLADPRPYTNGLSQNTTDVKPRADVKGPQSSQFLKNGTDPLTEREVLQVEVFYRSHMTEVITCQCLVEMYYGKSQDKGGPGVSGKGLDLSQWTYCTNGIPVLVLDTGDSRSRQRNLSIVLAERGTGFTLWKEAVNHLTNYQTLLNNFHCLHTSKDHTKLVGFRFPDSIAASDFFHKYQATINKPDDDLLNIGSKSKKSKRRDKKTVKAASVRKPAKGDISSPCCFTHITTMDRDFGALSLQDSNPQSQTGHGSST